MDRQNPPTLPFPMIEEFLMELKECKVAEDWQCIICTDRAPTEDQGQGGDNTSKILEIGDVPVETPKCHHVFHHSCLYQWVIGNQENHYTCPMCRTELFDESCDQGYLWRQNFITSVASDDDTDADSDAESDENMRDADSDDNSDTESDESMPNADSDIDSNAETVIEPEDSIYDGASEAGTDFDMDVGSNQEPEMTPDELSDAVARAMSELKRDFGPSPLLPGNFDPQTRVIRLLSSTLTGHEDGSISANWRDAIREARLDGEGRTRLYGHETELHARVGDIWWEVLATTMMVERYCSGTDWAWVPEKQHLQRYFLDLCDRYRGLRDAVEE